MQEHPMPHPELAHRMHDNLPVVPTVSMQKAVGETLAEKKSRMRDRPRFRNERDYDRAQDAARMRRVKKTNGRRTRAWQQQKMAAETLAAQIRVASGRSETASPALVANARKALEPKVAELREQFPDITDDEAFEAMATAIGLVR